jgi:hypothetical protein
MAMAQCRAPPSEPGHNAGFLTFETVVTYPIHPLVGETVLVIGDYEHDGIRHFLIRQSSGGSYQVPDWMFDPAATRLAVISIRGFRSANSSCYAPCLISS